MNLFQDFHVLARVHIVASDLSHVPGLHTRATPWKDASEIEWTRACEPMMGIAGAAVRTDDGS